MVIRSDGHKAGRGVMGLDFVTFSAVVAKQTKPSLRKHDGH